MGTTNARSAALDVAVDVAREDRTLLSASFDFDLALDLASATTKKGAPSFASFAKGGNHGRLQRRP
jgi:hypothetical protein